jgi:hypothetical protein
METLCVDSSRWLRLASSVVVGLVFVGWDVSHRGVKALIVEPVDPFRGAEFHVVQAVPGPARLVQLRFSKSDLGLHERVVQGVADGAGRGVDAGLDEVSGERKRRVLAARVRVMNEPGTCGDAGPGRDIGEVGNPPLVRTGCGEVTSQQVRGPLMADPVLVTLPVPGLLCLVRAVGLFAVRRRTGQRGASRVT